jgi:outer membrane protein assembly factor BamB
MTRHNSTNSLLPLATFFSIFTILGFFFQSFAQNSESDTVKLTKCSEFQIESPVADALSADAQKVYIGTADGSVRALNSTISSGLWRTELGGEIVSNIVSPEAGLFVISNPVKSADAVSTESVLRSLSKETGVPNWSVRLPFSERFFIGSIQGVVSVVSSDGWVASIDTLAGRIRWQTPSFGKVTARPSFLNGISFGTVEKKVIIVSAETGEIVFKVSTDFIPTAITYPSPDTLVVGDERGNVASIGVPGGKNIWKFKSGAAISFVQVSKEGLYITSLDNFIYLISMYNGDVIWKRRLPGRVIEGGVVLDGYVAVLIFGENSAFLIDSKKGKIVDQLEQTDKNFVNQVPVAIRNSGLLTITSDTVTLYSIKNCSLEIGKATSTMPPLTKK